MHRDTVTVESAPDGQLKLSGRVLIRAGAVWLSYYKSFAARSESSIAAAERSERALTPIVERIEQACYQ